MRHNFLSKAPSSCWCTVYKKRQNPNGSDAGITGNTAADGRITIMMPHPERVFRKLQMSWHPKDWKEFSPWMQIFVNARKFSDEN